MTQENTNEIEVTIKKKVTLRGSGMDVLDILDLTKTNNNSVRLTLLVGKLTEEENKLKNSFYQP